MYKTTYRGKDNDKGWWGILGYYHVLAFIVEPSQAALRWWKRKPSTSSSQVINIDPRVAVADQVRDDNGLVGVGVADDVSDENNRAQFPDIRNIPPLKRRLSMQEVESLVALTVPPPLPPNNVNANANEDDDDDDDEPPRRPPVPVPDSVSTPKSNA
jgi:hypothetical protein